jgi:hypothetical protein
MRHLIWRTNKDGRCSFRHVMLWFRHILETIGLVRSDDQAVVGVREERMRLENVALAELVRL